MRVLLLSQIFWPEGADYKNPALATELVARGHEVTVLTTYPNHPIGRIYDGYRQKLWQWEELDGYRVLRVPIYPDHSKSIIRRLFSYISFTFTASTVGLVLTGRHDVVLVGATPITLGWTAGLYKLFFGTRIILDILDIWPEAIASSGSSKSGRLLELVRGVAKKAYKMADLISVPTEGFRQTLMALGVPAEKMTIIPIWPNRQGSQQCERDEEFGRKYDLAGKTCIIYTGNIGPMQDIKSAVLGAEALRDIPDVKFVFVGAGQDLAVLKEYVAQRGMTNVVFAGHYPQDKMAGIMAWADALMVTLKDDPYLEINYPSKVSTYLTMGKPILVSAKGEIRDLVENNGLGFGCDPGDVEGFGAMVIKLLRLPEAEKSAVRQRTAEVFATMFNKSIGLRKYVEMIER